MRSSGPLLLGVLVVLGYLPALYYHFERPRLERERDRLVASAPTTTEGRLEQWRRYGDPMIHRRLAEVGRYSAEKPWLVTHAVRLAGKEVEFHGVRADLLPRAITRQEGATIVIELPAPVALGRGVLEGDEGKGN